MYKINFKLLRKAKERGFCLCELNKNDENICPCEDFLSKHICRCGVFTKIEEIEEDEQFDGLYE